MKFNNKYKKFCEKIMLSEENGATIEDLKKADLNKIIKSIDLSTESARHGLDLVMMDVNKFDQLWKKVDTYIGKGGSGDGVRTKYQNVIDFFLLDPETRKDKTGATNINATDVVVSDEGVYIAQGRHRLAVLRDAGVKKLPVAMDDQSMAKAKEIGLI